VSIKTRVEAGEIKSVGFISQRLRDYGVLMKFKLSLTVVFSAVMAFLIALKGELNWINLGVLFFGGFFITGAASSLNQVLEKDYDGLMKRTEKRPLVSGRITTSEAVLVAGLACLLGVSLLALFNPMSAFLGMVSLVTYAFIYTPMKRVSNVAVIIGAIPGALPMVIGCTAVQGELTYLSLSLFAIQFFWQNAGFNLLPTNDGRKDKNTGIQAAIYALFLVPISWVPYALGTTNVVASILLTLAALYYSFLGFKLSKDCSREAARKLMFYSFFYLPFVLFAMYFCKV
jgi:heme o synthase